MFTENLHELELDEQGSIHTWVLLYHSANWLGRGKSVTTIIPNIFHTNQAMFTENLLELELDE